MGRSDKYLIAYDIASHRRRRKIAKTLEACGIRINKSVFVCTVESDKQLAELLAVLQANVGKNDLIYLQPLCKRCYEAAWFIEPRMPVESRRKRRTKQIGLDRR